MEKKSAVHAQILWNWRCESSGMYWWRECSFILVIRFLDMVRRRRQKLKESEAAEPLVMAMPTPITCRRSRCSDMNE